MDIGVDRPLSASTMICRLTLILSSTFPYLPYLQLPALTLLCFPLTGQSGVVGGSRAAALLLLLLLLLLLQHLVLRTQRPLYLSISDHKKLLQAKTV